ncbi:MAG: hypothetical protein AAB309_00850, partial [Deltaproteobacteria bacterium]
GLYQDYSHVWFKSLASGGSEHSSGAEEVLTIILRDILLSKCQADPTTGKTILEEFLGNKYRFPVFRRFVLLCIDKQWSHYGGLLDVFLEIVPTALQESDYEVELQDILLHHNQSFGDGLISRLKQLIEKVPEYYIKEGEKLTAHWRFKWFSPLKDNPKFTRDYNQAREKAEPKDGKPYEPERSAFKGGFVSHKSPISKEEILQKPMVELVKYLNEFQGADSWHGSFEGEPDKQGLAEALQSTVKDDPKKFTDHIEEFCGAPYSYIHRLLRGLLEAWGAKKDLDWIRIFDFCLKYIGRDKEVFLKEALQAQGEDSGKGRYIWVIDDAVDLIDAGCRDDARAFDPIHFEKVKGIFDSILPLLKGEKHPDTQRDALTYVFNTTLGKTVEAFISFSLRIARSTKTKEEKWGQRKYDRFFSIGIDPYIWFGYFLPQMRYLDEAYADNKVRDFSNRSADDFEWQMFMEGYLSGHRFYKDVYFLMRSHYIKALENKVLQEKTDQRLDQHITIGYLHGHELLQENNADGQKSLFWKMFTEASSLGKQDRWLETVSFFWSLTPRTIK